MFLPGMMFTITGIQNYISEAKSTRFKFQRKRGSKMSKELKNGRRTLGSRQPVKTSKFRIFTRQ